MVRLDKREGALDLTRRQLQPQLWKRDSSTAHASSGRIEHFWA